MRMTRILGGIWLLTWACISCKDEFSVDLSNRKYIRLDKQHVSITVDEKIIVKAKTDTLGTASANLTWSILDPEVASIESRGDHTAIVTGLREGNTIIKVETNDGAVQYFSDLTVGTDRVIKILAIGNSFSEDAIENHLYELARAAGHQVRIANMYIGEASLEDHWGNASENAAAYQLRTIARDGSRNVANEQTLQAVIAAENWDYISFQEVSQRSGLQEGYDEYLPDLVDYARDLTSNPEVKFILHQTWAYAQDAAHEGFINYDNDQMTMYNAIVDAVRTAKDNAGMDIVVPAGTAIQNGRTSYIGDKFNRDGYRLSLGLGRFTAASVWFETLFGGILNNTYIPDNFSEYDAQLAKHAAAKAVEDPAEINVLSDFLYPAPNDFDLTAPIYIDFGGVASEQPFNNFGHPNDLRLTDLKDANGANSSFVLEVTQPFTGTLDRGLQNTLGWPQTVSQDMFFSDGINISQSSLVVSNLNRNKKYTFVFYGSINDNMTETAYIVTGKNEGVGYLDNDNNLEKLAVIKDIEPADDATITIKMAPGPNNNHWARFFGVNAAIILPEGQTFP